MFSAFSKRMQSYGSFLKALINTFIAVLTAIVQQLTTAASYRCPCVSIADLRNCTDATLGSSACSRTLNFGYGISFIIAPAIVLFLFGIAANPYMWKTTTGVFRKVKRQRREVTEILFSFMRVFTMGSIAPVTWVTVALLDGRFYACATTPLPYDVDRKEASYKNCEAVATAKMFYMSNTFIDNRSFSQALGMVALASAVLVSMLIYITTQSLSPFTYYHYKYYRLYKSAEEDVFEEEMRRKAKEKATENVKHFLCEDRRTKSEWDRVSTVYDLRSNPDQLKYYSNLQEWATEHYEAVEASAAAETENDGDSERRPLIEV